MSKIHHRLDAQSQRRRAGELIFLAIVFAMLGFLAGYVLGSAHPMKPSSLPWAENLGKAKR